MGRTAAHGRSVPSQTKHQQNGASVPTFYQEHPPKKDDLLLVTLTCQPDPPLILWVFHTALPRNQVAKGRKLRLKRNPFCPVPDVEWTIESVGGPDSSEYRAWWSEEAR